MTRVSSCFIHIGAPKTGTTFLQRVLYDNRVLLREQGILYPDASLRGFGHHDLAFLLNGGYPDWATSQPRPLSELCGDLAKAAASHSGKIILSSEDFFLFPQPEGLMHLLRSAGIASTHTIKIIVYLRRQDEAHASWYNQSVKALGYTGDLDSCVRENRDLWDYRVQLKRWAAIFGGDNMIVRPYEHGQFFGASLIADFFHRIDADYRQLAIPAEPINTSLNTDILDFQRNINRLPLTIQEKRRFRQRLIDLTARTAGTGIFDEAPLMGGKQRREVLAGYGAGNAEVARTYLGQPQLFLPVPPDSPDAGIRSSGLTPEKLAAILGWLVIGQD